MMESNENNMVTNFLTDMRLKISLLNQEIKTLECYNSFKNTEIEKLVQKIESLEEEKFSNLKPRFKYLNSAKEQCKDSLFTSSKCLKIVEDYFLEEKNKISETVQKDLKIKYMEASGEIKNKFEIMKNKFETNCSRYEILKKKRENRNILQKDIVFLNSQYKNNKKQMLQEQNKQKDIFYFKMIRISEICLAQYASIEIHSRYLQVQVEETELFKKYNNLDKEYKIKRRCLIAPLKLSQKFQVPEIKFPSGGTLLSGFLNNQHMTSNNLKRKIGDFQSKDNVSHQTYKETLPKPILPDKTQDHKTTIEENEYVKTSSLNDDKKVNIINVVKIMPSSESGAEYKQNEQNMFSQKECFPSETNNEETVITSNMKFRNSLSNQCSNVTTSFYNTQYKYVLPSENYTTDSKLKQGIPLSSYSYQKPKNLSNEKMKCNKINQNFGDNTLTITNDKSTSVFRGDTFSASNNTTNLMETGNLNSNIKSFGNSIFEKLNRKTEINDFTFGNVSNQLNVSGLEMDTYLAETNDGSFALSPENSFLLPNNENITEQDKNTESSNNFFFKLGNSDIISQQQNKKFFFN